MMISNNCIVGVNFTAGIGSNVVSSAIGRDVRLGANASIRQSVVMDGVTIEDQ
jgi:NDP-sugar pyrophosphorylase family protein